MTDTAIRDDETTDTATDRVLIVSNDSHVSPPFEVLRPYCPSKYLDEFDEYAVEMAPVVERLSGMMQPDVHPEAFRHRMQWFADQTLLHYDPHLAVKHMDEDGRAVETFFHGAMNGCVIPFLSDSGQTVHAPWKEGPRGAELALVGLRIYNRWLSDFVSVAPERIIGLAHIPFWDIDAAVTEMEFAREAGLRGMNFPAPRPELADYNELVWEPVWSAAESLGMPLSTHAASHTIARHVATYTGIDGHLCSAFDHVTFSRRGVAFMILGGVFERHPGLKLLFAEQPANWIQMTLNDLDGLWAWERYMTKLPRRPSEYFWSNCFVGISFMSHQEALTTVEQGMERNIMWGADYPHIEGTWPNTRLALRKTFAGIPEDAVRRMLGLNTVDVYGLDLAKLQPIVDRIGPTMKELQEPLGPHDLDGVGTGTLAFREMSFYA